MSRPRAVLLDALGTLLELQPPAPLLREALHVRLGLQIEPERVTRALAGEIDYYRAHHLEGRDPRSLSALRARCTEVLRAGLVAHGARVQRGRGDVVAALEVGPVHVEVGEGGGQRAFQAGTGDGAAVAAGGQDDRREGHDGDECGEGGEQGTAHGGQPPVMSRRRSRTKASSATTIAGSARFASGAPAVPSRSTGAASGPSIWRTAGW